MGKVIKSFCTKVLYIRTVYTLYRQYDTVRGETMLESIKSPDDIKSLDKKEVESLCREIREKLITTVSKNGGHLASNLGTVELTVALHRKFNSPKDKLIFDVGHQCYTHKLLTGRFDDFDTIRKDGGLSGFLRPEESEHDIFVSGHSSTSISAALGIAQSNALLGKTDYTVAIIGDGALTGGLSFEGLNNAGKTKTRLIVVLNDNKMSISKNVGALPRHLAVIRSHPSYFNLKTKVEKALGYIPLVGKPMTEVIRRVKKGLKNLFYNSTIFEDMGFAYMGPVDGHDVETLEDCFEVAKRMKRPALIHICTVKGKGYSFAEKSPADFHGVSSGMDINTGECDPSGKSFSGAFGKKLCELANNNQKICAVTAAMTDGTGLSEFSKKFSERFFDVGIAEQHALTFASGLAKGGHIPVVALYSAFLQRGFDQLVHDIAAQNLKIILCVDRAGIVGEDGEMHHGLFDVAFLSTLPEAVIYSPKNFAELESDLETAVNGQNRLYVIRYPRGGESIPAENLPRDFECFCGEDKSTLAVSFGRVGENVLEAARELDICGLSFNKIKPIPEDAENFCLDFDKIYFFEEGVENGGFCQKLLSRLCQKGFKGDAVITAPEDFVAHGSTSRLLSCLCLDKQSIINTVTGKTQHKKFGKRVKSNDKSGTDESKTDKTDIVESKNEKSNIKKNNTCESGIEKSKAETSGINEGKAEIKDAENGDAKKAALK